MSIISKDSVVLKQGRNFRRINKDTIKKEAIRNKDKELIDTQRNQLRKGRMGNGFLPDYSPYSQKLKDRSNYKATWPTMDLYDTGSFQNKMQLELTSSSVLYDSTDEKTSDLVSRFSEEIFEPYEKTKEINKNIVTPEYNKLIHKEINK